MGEIVGFIITKGWVTQFWLYSGQFKCHRCTHRCKIIRPFLCALSVLVVIVIVVVIVITTFHSNLSNESTSTLLTTDCTRPLRHFSDPLFFKTYTLTVILCRCAYFHSDFVLLLLQLVLDNNDTTVLYCVIVVPSWGCPTQLYCVAVHSERFIIIMQRLLQMTSFFVRTLAVSHAWWRS